MSGARYFNKPSNDTVKYTGEKPVVMKTSGDEKM
jgi:hypothetical protein